MKIYYFGCQIEFNRQLTCIIEINPLKLMALGEREIYRMSPLDEPGSLSASAYIRTEPVAVAAV